jgi:putative ABC transport system permease protein
MDPALVEKIRGTRGVEHVEMLRSILVDSPEFGEVQLNAVTSLDQRNSRTFRFVQGDASEVWNRVALGAVVVTEPFANRHRLRQNGASVTLNTKNGPKVFPVEGIYYDYSSDQGSILMSLDVYRKFWDDQKISGASVYVEPNVNSDRVMDDIRASVRGDNLVVQSNQALRNSALAIFDRTFAITLALRLIAIVVAFIGVLSALMALQIERTREFGTLRAVGLTMAQVWRLTLMESGLMGATAGLLAAPVGFAIAVTLIYVINYRSFGWTIFFQPTPEAYVQAFLVSTIAAVLAAVYPMIRLRNLEVADALREE